jgi:hypothetical protein
VYGIDPREVANNWKAKDIAIWYEEAVKIEQYKAEMIGVYVGETLAKLFG